MSAAGTLFSAASIAFGAEPYVIHTVVALTFLAIATVSLAGRSTVITRLRPKKLPTVMIPPSIETRRKALKMMHAHQPGNLFDRLAGHARGTPTLIPEQVLNDVFETRNAYSGFAVCDDTERVSGFFGIYALRRDKHIGLCRGDIAYADLSVKDFLPLEDRHAVFHVDMVVPRTTPRWVDGISDRDQRTIYAMLFGAYELLDKVYLNEGRTELTIYGIEKSPQDCEFLPQVGFTVDAALSARRTDGRIVYGKIITRDELVRLREELGVSEADAHVELRKRRLTRRHMLDTV